MFHLSEKAVGSIARAAFTSGCLRSVWLLVLFNFVAMNGPDWLRGLLFGGGPIWSIVAGLLIYGGVWAISLPGVESKAIEAARKESSSIPSAD